MERGCRTGIKRVRGVGSCRHKIPLKRLNVFGNRLQEGTTISTPYFEIFLFLIYLSVSYKNRMAEREETTPPSRNLRSTPSASSVARTATCAARRLRTERKTPSGPTRPPGRTRGAPSDPQAINPTNPAAATNPDPGGTGEILSATQRPQQSNAGIIPCGFLRRRLLARIFNEKGGKAPTILYKSIA